MSAVAQRAAQTRAMVAARRQMGLAKKPRKRLPPQIWPSAIARSYAQRIAGMVDVRQAYEPLLRELPGLLSSARGERMDAGESARLRKLAKEAEQRLKDQLNEPALDALAREFAAKTSTHQRVQLNKQVHAALGADIFAGEPNLSTTFDAFADENVALITKISSQVAAEIETMVTRAVTDGKLSKDLSADLQKAFGFPAQRAQLIATDQIGKLYGQLNAQRQQALGVARFIWRTASDSRVRPEHVARNGKEYEYAHPPDGELPGTPIRCRCYGEPIFDDLLAPGDKAPLPSAPAPAPKAKPVKATPTVKMPQPPPYSKRAEIKSVYLEGDDTPTVFRGPEGVDAFIKHTLDNLPKVEEIWLKERDGWIEEAKDKPEGSPTTYTEREFRVLRNAWTDKQRSIGNQAGLFYSRYGDEILNGLAREGGDAWERYPEAKRIRDELDKYLRGYKTPKKMVVSRGVVGEWAQQFADSLKLGDVFADPAYTSTAASRGYDGDVEMVITVPKGAHGAPIASYFGLEDEFLLPRDTKFRLTKKEERLEEGDEEGTTRTVRVLHLEVIP